MILLGLDDFFVKICKKHYEPPYKTYIVVFWNREFNLYKEQNLAMGKMKHEMEESSGGAPSKQCQVMELEKLPTPEELGKINFVGCMHGSIWTLMKEETNLVKKVGLHQIRKLN